MRFNNLMTVTQSIKLNLDAYVYYTNKNNKADM